MSLLVGYPVDGRAGEALELARLMAVTSGQRLVVCCAIPDRFGAVGPGRAVDADYAEHLRSLASDALAEAAERFARAPGVDVSYEIVTARSAPGGVLEAIERFEPTLVVCGSADGAWGRITLGSVTDYLLHSSPVPVALAHRGAHYGPEQRITRITVALDGTDSSPAVLIRAAAVAESLGARLRLVVFAVRPRRMVPSLAGYEAEDRVVDLWRQDARATIERACAGLDGLGGTPELVVSDGQSWSEAMERPGWENTDVLVIGSSPSRSSMARVFLGSTASRMIRHSPVPVVVVP